MENPNEYDNNAWTQYSVDAQMGLSGFWESGASVEDVREVIANALSDSGTDADVTLLIEPGTPDNIVRQPKPKAKKNG